MKKSLTAGTDSSNNVKPVVNMTVTPSYKAYAAATQQPDTYKGTTTYNFATNAE